MPSASPAKPMVHGLRSNVCPLRWNRIVGTHQVGMPCRQGIYATEPWRNKPSLNKREANATPELFRDAMIALASESQRKAAGLADEKPDGQAENVDVDASPPLTPQDNAKR